MIRRLIRGSLSLRDGARAQPRPHTTIGEMGLITGLNGAYRIRTGESVRELSDWNFLTTSPEVGASLAAETLRVRAA